MKHKHADVMLEYAKDAQESDKPWVNWEFLNTQIGFWRKCTAHPEWKAYHNYRRNAKTIRIGEYDAPISMFVEKPECHSDNDHIADTSKMIDRYTVEPHGKGFAIYLGRDNKHHGANLAHLSECSPAFADQIQALLNGSYTPQKPILGSDIENLLSKLETHIAHMPAHQRERQQGELLIRATNELLRIQKAIE